MIFYEQLLYELSRCQDFTLAGMTLSFLLLIATPTGFGISTAAASLPLDNTTRTDGGDTSANTSMSENNGFSNTTINLADEPIAIGHYRTVSNNMTGEGQVLFTFEGNTTIAVPNSTETIMTMDTGQGNVTFLLGGGTVIRGQIHMTTEDGSENATADFTEFLRSEASTGIGVAYFSTSSTENLAPLNNITAVYLDEIQPNEDSIVRFFEWKSGDLVPMSTDPTSGANNTLQ